MAGTQANYSWWMLHKKDVVVLLYHILDYVELINLCLSTTAMAETQTNMDKSPVLFSIQLAHRTYGEHVHLSLVR